LHYASRLEETKRVQLTPTSDISGVMDEVCVKQMQSAGDCVIS